MKRVFLVLAVSAWAVHAAAAGPSCMSQAAEKKLSGAAKTSFMKKCETDAKAACEASAQDRKLAGAAKTSFLKKCAEDAVGSK
jgi:hypothetical protein